MSLLTRIHRQTNGFLMETSEEFLRRKTVDLRRKVEGTILNLFMKKNTRKIT